MMDQRTMAMPRLHSRVSTTCWEQSPDRMHILRYIRQMESLCDFAQLGWLQDAHVGHSPWTFQSRWIHAQHHWWRHHTPKRVQYVPRANRRRPIVPSLWHHYVSKRSPTHQDLCACISPLQWPPWRQVTKAPSQSNRRSSQAWSQAENRVYGQRSIEYSSNTSSKVCLYMDPYEESSQDP